MPLLSQLLQEEPGLPGLHPPSSSSSESDEGSLWNEGEWFSIRFRTRSNECSGATINMSLSHFVTITQDLQNIEKHSTDPNECICRFTFLFEGASLFVVVVG